MTKVIKGISITPGIAIGKAIPFSGVSCEIPEKTSKYPKKEWKIFNEAVKAVIDNLEETLNSTHNSLGSDSILILQSYCSLLEDPIVIEDVKHEIFEKNYTAAWSVIQAFQKVRTLLERVSHAHISEKAVDLDTVRDFLLEQLVPIENQAPAPEEKLIIVSKELSPRDILYWNKKGTAGFISEKGTRSSHAAILARSVGVPTVFGAHKITQTDYMNEIVIIDSGAGKVTINPNREELEKFRVRKNTWEIWGKELKRSQLKGNSNTIDGTKIEVLANIESIEEVPAIKESSAQGVGLMRLEFFYMSQKKIVTPELLEEQIKNISKAIHHNPLTVRLLDIGGDKEVPLSCKALIQIEDAKNIEVPGGGLRGIRTLLKTPSFLKEQIKAVIKSNEKKNIKLLIPFVSCISEVIAVRSLLKDVWRELTQESDQEVFNMPDLGMMVELPAAVSMASLFAKEVDFFSLGTNDLTQFTLGVGRNDIIFSDIYTAYHPAIIIMIKRTVEESFCSQIPVSICGEMASNPLMTKLLIGLGIRELSCNAQSIPIIKEIIKHTELKEAQSLATEITQLKSSYDIHQRLQLEVIKIFGHEKTAMLEGWENS